MPELIICTVCQSPITDEGQTDSIRMWENAAGRAFVHHACSGFRTDRGGEETGFPLTYRDAVAMERHKDCLTPPSGANMRRVEDCDLCELPMFLFQTCRYAEVDMHCACYVQGHPPRVNGA